MFTYKSGVRALIEGKVFTMQVFVVMKDFGVGLPASYLEELFYDDIDGKSKKVAEITCNRPGIKLHFYKAIGRVILQGNNCFNQKLCHIPFCIRVNAWVCPSVLAHFWIRLSKCIVRYANPLFVTK